MKIYGFAECTVAKVSDDGNTLEDVPKSLFGWFAAFEKR
jgi:hypothetical protein